MTTVELTLKVGLQRARELQQLGRAAQAQRAGYPDRERQPRIPRHWANRF